MPGRYARWGAVAATVLILAAAGCDAPPADTDGSVASSPGPTGYDGPMYRLPSGLCDDVELAPLADLYPTENLDSVLRNSGELQCDTTLRDASGHVLGLSVSLVHHDQPEMDQTPSLPAQWYEYQLTAFALESPTEIDGVGSAAFWYGDEYEVVLETYDGNIDMRVRVSSVAHSHTLAPDMPHRLAEVARGTMARLLEAR